jgi:hypothetical protein
MSDEQWPYPSYADRIWLGGDRGADRALAAVVRALRALVAESGGRPGSEPEPLLHGMGHLASMAERLDWAMLSLVAEARARGVSWATIGAALGVTKQAAQQRFGPYVAEALNRASSADGNAD